MIKKNGTDLLFGGGDGKTDHGRKRYLVFGVKCLRPNFYITIIMIRESVVMESIPDIPMHLYT